MARQPDGALRFRRPDGRPLPEVPPPAAGERLDLAWAIDVLHPVATGEVGSPGERSSSAP